MTKDKNDHGPDQYTWDMKLEFHSDERYYYVTRNS